MQPLTLRASSNHPASVAEKAERKNRRAAAMPIFALIGKLWPFMRPTRPRLFLLAGVSIVLTALEVATPVLVGLFVDSILAQLHGRAAQFAPRLNQTSILALIALGAVLRGFLVTRQRSLSGWIGERVATRMREALWNHLQYLPVDYTRARGAGQLLLRFTSDARAVQRLVTLGFVQVSQDILFACGVLGMLVWLNPRMGAAIAVIVPLFGLTFWRLNPQLRHESRATRARRSRLSAYLEERLAGMAVVKAFGKQDTEAENVKELSRDIARRATRRAGVEARLQGWTTATLALGSVAVLAIAAREASGGRLSAGTLVAFYTLLGLLLPVFHRIVAANQYFQEGQISVERLVSTLSVARESRRTDKAPDLRVTHGEITMQDVSFGPKRGPAILKNISLSAKRGELVAVIGGNGSGKTTLVELLLRFHQPTGGQILIDGQDISAVSLNSLREQIGLVIQEAPVFDGSVKENIAYGLPADAPDTTIERAARLAGVDRFVSSLPKGWDTRVGRGGRNLSNGQRRRLALARALATDPRVLIVDEPLASLDPETEHSLISLLRELAMERTVLVAAQRVPASLKPDRVYVLEDGAATLRETRSTGAEAVSKSGPNLI
jgi:subfamily B ATP-binding cassette protein MsbA